MSTVNDGGRAFPNDGAWANGHPEGGMSLRDYFAAQVAGAVHQTVCDGTHRPQSGIAGPEFIAATAYQIADAMLTQRAKDGAA